MVVRGHIIKILLAFGILMAGLVAVPSTASAAGSNTITIMSGGYEWVGWNSINLYGPGGYYRHDWQQAFGRSTFTGMPGGQYRVRVTLCDTPYCNGGSRWELNGYGTLDPKSWRSSDSWACIFGATSCRKIG
jgi:hypothetical protein